MADRVLAGARHGLFDLCRDGTGWAFYNGLHFLGDPVGAVVQDPRGALWVALDLGHLGMTFSAWHPVRRGLTTQPHDETRCPARS